METKRILGIEISALGLDGRAIRHSLLRHHLGGVLAAMGAGLAWGLVFVLPLLLPEYPATLLAFGRYLAFGLVTLPFAYRFRHQLAALTRRDWVCALRLALVGNLIYYLALAAAIRLAGAPLPTLIIGTLPVVIAVTANLQARRFAWSRLLPSLILILSGLAAVNLDAWRRLDMGQGRELLLGGLLAALAVAAWTWYPLRNAAWLRAAPGRSASVWATAQGVMTLPLAALGYLATVWHAQANGIEAFASLDPLALGPTPLRFWLLMFVVGFAASWLGTWLWNLASQWTPAVLTGQLLVFETLAALFYAYLVYKRAPGLGESLGIALLIAGVLLGVRRLAARPGSAPG